MPLRDIVVHNFWWKLLSLLLAALTWLTIETALKREQVLRQTPVVGSYFRDFPALPITLLTASTNTNHFKIDPATASVRISGPAEQLQKLQEPDIHVYIDLSDIGDEKQVRRPIRADVPKELKVDNLNPPNATAERISETK